MLLTASLTIGGAILLGLAARKAEKNPLLILGGVALMGGSLFVHLAGPAPLVESLGYASAELGTGLLVVAGMLAGRDGSAKSWFTLGAGAVAVGLAVILMRSMTAGGFGSLLVELGPDDTYAEIAEIVESHGATAERAFPSVSLEDDADLAQVFLIRVPRKYLDRLREILGLDKENVDHVELNLAVSLDLPVVAPSDVTTSGRVLENDPLVGSQWGLDAIRGHEAHALLKDLTPARKARVAIVDTGVDSRHEDIDAVFEDSPGSSDQHGHGSHCAGIAGATTNNRLGVASLNWEGRFVSIISFSALNANGSGTLESTAQAIIDATQAGADVISMSLGASAPVVPKTIVDAVEFARQRGAIVVAAAGNANIDARNNVPSNVEGVIAVGAVDENLQKASFSNSNTSLSRPIAAPGVNVLSLRPTGGYVKLSGTSMATPMVAGLLGVMRSINPDLDGDHAYDLLVSTGRSTAASSSVGLVIDAEKAIVATLDEL
jgi:thermitase